MRKLEGGAIIIKFVVKTGLDNSNTEPVRYSDFNCSPNFTNKETVPDILLATTLVLAADKTSSGA